MSNRSRNAGDRRGVSPNVDVMYSLKVDNLTYRTRVEDLRRCFEKFGHIGDIYIPRDQFSRSSRGYAFVRCVYSSKRRCSILISVLLKKIIFLGFLKNVMHKMHWTVWMELILMDVKYVYNLLVMAELQQLIVVKKLVVIGKIREEKTII